MSSSPNSTEPIPGSSSASSTERIQEEQTIKEEPSASPAETIPEINEEPPATETISEIKEEPFESSTETIPAMKEEQFESSTKTIPAINGEPLATETILEINEDQTIKEEPSVTETRAHLFNAKQVSCT